MTAPCLAIVVPCYNEEVCIDNTTKRLLEILKELENEHIVSENSFIFYSNDGSMDATWSKIQQYNKETSGKVKGIKFSRNFGNQRAILAGLFEASKYNPDCYITIDADLQQDETKIKEFVQKYNNGAKIVSGIRNDRRTDGLIKKITALAFYKTMNMLGVNLKVNHSEYRLISKEIVYVLKSFPETNMFLRGIFNDLGFEQDYVNFDVKERSAGKSKYTFLSLFSLAVNGITSFSIVPLRMVSVIGLLMALIGFIVGVHAVYCKFFSQSIVPGWATIVAVLGFIGGIQIFCIGIIGEYIGQLFQEVKSRPRYIIEESVS